MGEFGGNERWDENPFVFFQEGELINEGMEKINPPNPIRAIYEDIAPLVLESPPSKRYPQEPSAVTGFNILTDPLSALIPTSAVPDPIIGLTTQRAMRRSIAGEEGMATHLNIVLDISGSMQTPKGDGSSGLMCYGFTPEGFAMGGTDIGTIVVAMMVQQAQLSGDTFALYAFGNDGSVVWEGPSQQYKECLEWLLASYDPHDASRPFYANSGTVVASGINIVGESLEGYDFDQCVTVLITDGSFRGNRNSDLFNTNYPYTDEEVRKLGPLFYVIIGSDNFEQAQIDSVKAFQGTLEEHYKQNMDGCVLGFTVSLGEDGNFADFAGSLVDMAKVNSGESKLKPCPKIE